MATRRSRSVIALACAGLLLAGCGDTGDRGPGAPTPSQDDAGTLLERALAVREDRPTEFAELVAAASRACPDPDAGRRLGEVAITAARWSSAVLEGRPKAQAVTEAQLTTIDWDALASACAAS